MGPAVPGGTGCAGGSLCYRACDSASRYTRRNGNDDSCDGAGLAGCTIFAGIQRLETRSAGGFGSCARTQVSATRTTRGSETPSANTFRSATAEGSGSTARAAGGQNRGAPIAGFTDPALTRASSVGGKTGPRDS